MRGSPLLRALLAFVVILALGYPLRHLTGNGAAPGAAPADALPTAASEVKVQLTFTTSPRRFAFRHLGQELWSDQSGTAEVGTVLRLPYPAEGVDLQFSADFAEGAPLAAVRIVLTDPRGDEHVRSCWGAGHIEEVVTFP